MNSNTAYLPAHTSGNIYLSHHHPQRYFHHRRSQHIAAKKNILHQAWFGVFTFVGKDYCLLGHDTMLFGNLLVACWTYHFHLQGSPKWTCCLGDLIALNGKQQLQQCLQQAIRRGHIMEVGENGSMQPVPPPFLFACYRYCWSCCFPT
jgi:hypothetical protein